MNTVYISFESYSYNTVCGIITFIRQIGVSRALSALYPLSKKQSLTDVPSIGTNPGK